MGDTPVKRLERANVVEPGYLTDDEKEIVNGMTDEEVDVLIRLRERLGPAPAGRHGAKPNFPL